MLRSAGLALRIQHTLPLPRPRLPSSARLAAPALSMCPSAPLSAQDLDDEYLVVWEGFATPGRLMANSQTQNEFRRYSLSSEHTKLRRRYSTSDETQNVRRASRIDASFNRSSMNSSLPIWRQDATRTSSSSTPDESFATLSTPWRYLTSWSTLPYLTLPPYLTAVEVPCAARASSLTPRARRAHLCHSPHVVRQVCDSGGAA
jgi:hypothetical protein